jgi:hypothetical protein
MCTSQWIVFYFAIALNSSHPLLEAVYEALPAQTHVFEVGRRLAAVCSGAGLTKKISYDRIRYVRKYDFHQHRRIILTYLLRFSISHVEACVFAEFKINGEGLLFDLNTTETHCGIYRLEGNDTSPTSPITLRITEWWQRLLVEFKNMNLEHFSLLAMTPEQIWARLK